MARLAIGKEFLAEYAKLDRDTRSAVDTAVAEFARQTHAGPFLETPRDSRDSRIRTIGIDGVWRGVVLAPDSGDTYCLLTVLPQEKVNDFAASRRFGAARAYRVLEVRDEEELRLILAHPFAAWRAFLHPSQHEIAYRGSYSGSAQVTGGPGTGKTVTVLYRAAFLAERAEQLPLLGADPVTGLDGEADSLLGYRSPMHGPRPQAWQATSRTEEFGLLTERVGSWLSVGLEPHAIGVTARSAALVREAREALEAAGIATASLSGRSPVPAVRTGTMHAMKGLEFQAVAVIGVEQGLVPEPGAVAPETEDPLAYAQDLQRERCVLFVACTRARDHLHVSGTGEPSPFLPPGAVEPVPPPAALHSR